MLLDEPFSSLDRELRSSMHELLTEVRAVLSPTILLVIHELDEAALAEAAAVLVDGRLHQVAPVDELYRRPASLAVARLVGGFNEITGAVADGRHRSAWGVVDLPPGCDVDGSATLLVRREELEVAAPDAALDAGTGPDSGPRQTVDVEVDAGQARVVLEVELPIGERARVGDAVSVRTAPRATPWAVHAPGDAPTGSRRLASR